MASPPFFKLELKVKRCLKLDDSFVVFLTTNKVGYPNLVHKFTKYIKEESIVTIKVDETLSNYVFVTNEGDIFETSEDQTISNADIINIFETTTDEITTLKDDLEKTKQLLKSFMLDNELIQAKLDHILAYETF